MSFSGVQEPGPSSSRPETLKISKRVHIASLVTFALISLATTFQLAVIVNRVYKPEYGGISAFLLAVGYLQEAVLVLYLFAWFWIIRRPNIVIGIGGFLLLSVVAIVVCVITGLAQNMPPLAVGSTASKLKLYWGLKMACFIMSQIGAGFIGWTCIYSLPRSFKMANTYFAMWDDDVDSGSYAPPTTIEMDSHLDSRAMTLQALDESEGMDPYLFSGSRDTHSM